MIYYVNILVKLEQNQIQLKTFFLLVASPPDHNTLIYPLPPFDFPTFRKLWRPNTKLVFTSCVVVDTGLPQEGVGQQSQQRQLQNQTKAKSDLHPMKVKMPIKQEQSMTMNKTQKDN